MASTYKILTGTAGIAAFEIDLLYDAATQTDYKLKYGARVSSAFPDVLTHTPDFGEELPVRGVDRDRDVFLTLDFRGADIDTVLDNIARLKRAVDGADSQAFRYWTHGDVERVVLRVQLDGSDRYTDIPIKYGFVDDSGALLSAPGRVNDIAFNATVFLRVGRYGEGAEIEASNVLLSTPHMVEDWDADGIPDGWNVSGTVLNSLNETTWLIGGQCWQVAPLTTADYVFCDAVAATATTVSAYIWVAPESGEGASVRLVDSTAATTKATRVIDSTDSNTVSDQSYPDRASSLTWYRVVFNGISITNTNNHRLEITCETNGDTSYLDGAYMEFGAATCPDAFTSHNTIENRYDPRSAATEDNINYVDVWGVPGDAAAIVKQKVDYVVATNTDHLIAARTEDGTITVNNQVWYVDSADMTTSGSDWSNVVDGTRSGGEYDRNTRNIGVSELIQYDVTNISDIMTAPRRLFVLARSSDTASQVQLFSALGQTIQEDAVNFTAANTWEMIDLGVIHPIQFDGTVYTGGTQSVFKIRVFCAVAGTLDVDAAWIFPTGYEYLHAGSAASAPSASTDLYIFGADQFIQTNDSPIVWNKVGSLWYANPGVTNRYVYAIRGSDSAHTIGDSATFTYTITPRSRHLLGTL